MTTDDIIEEEANEREIRRIRQAQHQRLLGNIEQARVESAEQSVVEGLQAKGLLPAAEQLVKVAAVVLTRSQIGWQVERLPIHGCRVVDNTGRLIAADVYDEDIAEQIITEHNQHAALVTERERLLNLLKQAREFACLHTWGKFQRPTPQEAEKLVTDIDSALTTIEQEGGRRG